jgi:hypothetical protein
MLTTQEPFEIDDEAVYEDWLWFGWASPRTRFLGINLEYDSDCAQCVAGRCRQRVTCADDFEAYQHDYDRVWAS